MDTKTDRPRIRWGLIAGVTFCLVVVTLAVAWPNHIGSGPSEKNWVLSQLRLLDGAKEQWAMQSGKSDGEIVQWEELEQFLPVNFDENRPEWVRFVINPIGQSPEAVVLKGASDFRKGTVLGIGNDGRLAVKQPDF